MDGDSGVVARVVVLTDRDAEALAHVGECVLGKLQHTFGLISRAAVGI